MTTPLAPEKPQSRRARWVLLGLCGLLSVVGLCRLVYPAVRVPHLLARLRQRGFQVSTTPVVQRWRSV